MTTTKLNTSYFSNMADNINRFAVPLIITIFVSSLWILIVLSASHGGVSPQIVKCYDRYSNEIIGQECYKNPSPVFPSLTIKLIFLFIGLILINLYNYFIIWKDS